MKKRINEAMTDLCFLGILILVFAGIVFLAMDHNNFTFNIVVLCIAVILFMFVYFFSFRTGMILNIVFIFLFLAWSVAHSLNTGAAVGENVYFWLIWPLLMSAAITGYVWQKQSIEKENVVLQRKVERFVTIDDITQMNNLLAFERDARVYMNLSRRYHIPLVLVLWRLKSQADMERALIKEEIPEALSAISDAIRGSLRGEDLVYLVEKDPYIWGVLLFTDPQATGIVQGRVAENVRKAGLEYGADKKGFSMELIDVAVSYDGEFKTPLTFLTQAKDEILVSVRNKRVVQRRKKDKNMAEERKEPPVSTDDAAVLPDRTAKKPGTATPFPQKEPEPMEEPESTEERERMGEPELMKEPEFPELPEPPVRPAFMEIKGAEPEDDYDIDVDDSDDWDIE